MLEKVKSQLTTFNKTSPHVHAAIGAILFLLPFERIPSADIGLFGLDVTVRLSQVIGLGLIIYCLKKQGLSYFKDALTQWHWRFLAIFLVWCWITIPFSMNPKRSVIVTTFITFTVLAGYSLSQYVRDKWKDEYARYLYAGTIIVGVLCAYQYLGDLAGLDTLLLGLRDRYSSAVFGFPRIQGTSLEPLYLGSFLLIPIGVILSKAIISKLTKLETYLLIACTTMLVMTVSRGAIVAFVGEIILAAGFAFYIHAGRKFLKGAGLLVIGVAIGALLITQSSSIQNVLSVITNKAHSDVDTTKSFTTQVTNFSDGGSLNEREEQRLLGIKAFQSAPVMGVGSGAFGTYAHSQNAKSFPDETGIVNNQYIELAAETGIIGFGLFAAFAISLVIFSVKNILWTIKKNSLSYLYCGAFLATFAAAIQYLAVSTLYIMHIWVMIGIIASIGYFARTENTKLKKKAAKS